MDPEKGTQKRGRHSHRPDLVNDYHPGTILPRSLGPGGMNLEEYADNSPTGLADPLGLWAGAANEQMGTGPISRKQIQQYSAGKEQEPSLQRPQ